MKKTGFGVGDKGVRSWVLAAFCCKLRKRVVVSGRELGRWAGWRDGSESERVFSQQQLFVVREQSECDGTNGADDGGTRRTVGVETAGEGRHDGSLDVDAVVMVTSTRPMQRRR